MTNVTTVTKPETDLVSASNDANAAVVVPVADVTSATTVTSHIDDAMSEFFEFIDKKWDLNGKAAPTCNSSGFWRFEDFEDKPGNNTGWASPILLMMESLLR